MSTRRNLGAVVGAAALLFATPLAASASSSHQPRVTTVNTTVVSPFNLSINKGHVFVADGGTSLVSRLMRNGTLHTVATGPQPGEVAGVDLSSNGRYLAYTSTDYASGATSLNINGPRGSRRSVDLSTYESTRNPDGHVSYGVRNPSQCVIDALGAIPDGPPASYKGIVESHPYSVASYGSGWIVADAAGNDLLKVDSRGHIRTLAVLPKQPLKITAAIAGALGLPDCVIGVTYNFEPVPTDVEVGHHGQLYVTTLAGGPEDPSIGARSSVYRVNARTGHVKKIASGLSGATNLALGKSGKVYVAELFAGRISVISHGRPKMYVPLASVVSVESDHGSLWAGTMAEQGENGPIGTGSIVHITPRR